MVYLLYDFLILLSACFVLPFFYVKRIITKQASYGIRERLGLYGNEKINIFKKQKIIWIHAASVGETQVALLLARRIKEDYINHAVLVTNMTRNGQLVAQQSELVNVSILFPVDLSFVVERLLKMIRPELVIVVETELWPNFIRLVSQGGIPLVLVNGRVSDRSFPRYRFLRFLLRPMLGRFSAFCMQSQEDTERIAVLGAPSEKVENTGNLKFDYSLQDVTEKEVQRRKNNYRLPEGVAILVAGSTHEGEEKQLLEIYRQVASKVDRNLLLVLIPRYPERKREVQVLLKESGFTYRLRSSLCEEDDLLSPGEVLLVDSLGEVLDLYSTADLVFVGGSLIPIGGHNLLEAALLAKPVIFGSYVQNFKEISTKLIRAGAGIKVVNQQDLARKMVIMLNDPARCRAMGEAGRSLIVENAGATERTMRYIAKYMKS